MGKPVPTLPPPSSKPPPGPPIDIGGCGLPGGNCCINVSGFGAGVPCVGPGLPPPGGNEGGGLLNLSLSLPKGPLLSFINCCMNGTCSPIGSGGGGGTGNGLAVGNSFVSVGGVKGIDGPTGKAETISSACGRPVSYLPITPVFLLSIFVGGATGLPMATPPLGPPIDIGGCGLPLTGPLKGTLPPTGKALAIRPPL